MILYEDATVTVCGPSGWEIIHDEIDGEPRWCFTCRKVREFRYIVGRDPDWMNDWYGPSASIKCGACQTTDGDCGFGRYREWGEE